MGLTIKDECLGKYFIKTSAGQPGRGLTYSVRVDERVSETKFKEVELCVFNDLGQALNYVVELRTLEHNDDFTLGEYAEFRESLMDDINTTLTSNRNKKKEEALKEDIPQQMEEPIGVGRPMDGYTQNATDPFIGYHNVTATSAYEPYAGQKLTEKDVESMVVGMDVNFSEQEETF